MTDLEANTLYDICNMDIIQFAEQMYGIKLHAYQKFLLKIMFNVEKHLK